MPEAEVIAELLVGQLPNIKSGTLRFWGEWFGKPHDNEHHIVRATADSSQLNLHFDQGELLSIWGPRGFLISDKFFRIDDASRVRWQWFYYGRAKNQENLYFFDFVKIANEVAASTNVDWYPLHLRPKSEMPAVEIL